MDRSSLPDDFVGVGMEWDGVSQEWVPTVVSPDECQQVIEVALRSTRMFTEIAGQAIDQLCRVRQIHDQGEIDAAAALREEILDQMRRAATFASYWEAIAYEFGDGVPL